MATLPQARRKKGSGSHAALGIAARTTSPPMLRRRALSITTLGEKRSISRPLGISRISRKSPHRPR